MSGPTHAPRRRVGATAAAVVALVALVVAGCSHSGSVPSVLAAGEKQPLGITVTSPAFDSGKPVPERFSCEGLNVPPPLAWTGVPDGATELALVIEDPGAPDGTFVHWLVVGVDPASKGIRGTDPPAGAEVLPGSSDNPTYIGPCPPDGDGAHRYYFEVYALDRRPALDPSARPLDNVRAVRKAAVAGGWLVGTFTR